jgi:hypothetical protein
MSSTSNSITWKTWSQKWGEWNTWYPLKVDKNLLNPSSRLARKAVHVPLVKVQNHSSDVRRIFGSLRQR